MILALALAAADLDLRPAGLAGCTPAGAAAVSVEELAGDPDRFQGRCVSVTGPTWHSSMFSGLEGFYRIRRGLDDYAPRRSDMQHRLGLYLDHDERPGDALRMLTVTGVADSCERMGRALKVEQAAEDRRATGPDDPIVIHMLGGYCHYYGGAVLWGTSWRALPWSGYERVTGEAARRRLGNLVHVERAWPRYGKLRRIGEDFRRAIREGDRARLSALHGKFGAGREELDYLLVDKDSPFLELRDLAHRGRTALLANDLGYEGEPPETVETADGFVCFCRAGDCGDLWPIADIDTGHAEEHPYACLEVSTDAVGEVDVRAKRTPAPLAEPPAARLPLPRR